MSKSSNNAADQPCRPGFTLIEAVLALTILLIGLLAVMRFFPLSLQITGESQSLSTATALAAAELEALRAEGYDQLTPGAIEPNHALSNDPDSFLSGYQRSSSVSLLDGNLNASGADLGLKKITTTVSWRSAITHTTKSYTIATLVSRN